MKPAGMVLSVVLIAWTCSLILVVDAHAACDGTAKRSTPDADFEFLAGGAVARHKITGLEWQRCPEGMTFVAHTAAHDSRDTCEGSAATFNQESTRQLQAKINAGAGRDGFTDWRLPSMVELSSIVEAACQVPAVNAQVFPDTPVTWFWADPPVALPGGSGSAWGIGFGAGGYYVGRHDYGAVRLVRGIRK
jgi:hypothetical protein